MLPSHMEINRYWFDKGALPRNAGVVIDSGEPSCFACGWWNWSDSNRVPWRGLERSHVLARSLGGTDDLENLALLCRRCHELAPDTTDVLWFWDWVRTRPSDTPIERELVRVGELLDALQPDVRTALEGLARAELGRRLRSLPSSFRFTTHYGVGISRGTWERIPQEVVRPETSKALD